MNLQSEQRRKSEVLDTHEVAVLQQRRVGQTERFELNDTLSIGGKNLEEGE